MEDCQMGSVYEALVLIIHVWHPLWLHVPSVSSEPTWWAWQLLPSTDNVLCLRIVGTCQTVGTSASHRQWWKLCVCDSPHILLCTPCSCWGNSWGLLPSAKFKQKQVPITESLAEFLSLSYLPISNYVSFAWNLRFCCVPHFCSWVSEMVQIWEVTVSECQGHRLVACTVGEGSLRN